MLNPNKCLHEDIRFEGLRVSFQLVLFVSPKEKKSVSESVRPRLAAFYVSRRMTLTYNIFWERKEVDHDRRGCTSPRGIIDRRKTDQTYLHRAQPKKKRSVDERRIG